MSKPDIEQLRRRLLSLRWSDEMPVEEQIRYLKAEMDISIEIFALGLCEKHLDANTFKLSTDAIKLGKAIIFTNKAELTDANENSFSDIVMSLDPDKFNVNHQRENCPNTVRAYIDIRRALSSWEYWCHLIGIPQPDPFS